MATMMCQITRMFPKNCIVSFKHTKRGKFTTNIGIFEVEEADSIMLHHAAYSEKDGVGVIMFEYTDETSLLIQYGQQAI